MTATSQSGSHSDPQEKDDGSSAVRATDDESLDPSAAAPQDYPQPIKEYGARWDWDPAVRDFVRLGEDGVKLLYTNYQKAGPAPETPDISDSIQNAPPSQSSPELRTVPLAIRPPVSGVPLWERPLGDGFQIVTKPKRFFCVGRIFKTVWFEPGSSDLSKKRPDGSETWADNCLPFRGERPAARFRWFIVVRRRLHHSLCFSITAFGGKGASKTTRGRPMDYVVLHSSNVEPPRPYEEEGITRDPIAIIVEDDEQYISPFARLDCGRIYTVEDDLRIMKVGRVHPAALPLLEQYYIESMSER